MTEPLCQAPTLSGSLCTRPAGWGTSHTGNGYCHQHEEQSTRPQFAVLDSVRAMGLPRTVDPATALLEEVSRTAGVVSWLGEKVAELDPDSIVHGEQRRRLVQSEKDGITRLVEAGPMRSEWVRLWQDERAHLVKVCQIAIAAGVEERRVRLAERQGDLLADVIRKILDDLDLSEDQLDKVADVVPRHLRSISA